MKFLLSPSKTMNESKVYSDVDCFNFDKTLELFEYIKFKDSNEIQKIYKCSSTIANQVEQYINDFGNKFYVANELYEGLVFKRIDYDSMNKEQQYYFNNNVLILDPLFGLVKPSDKICRYRLDLTIKLPIKVEDFWDFKIEEEQIINLASNEYTKMIKQPHITITFKQNKNGKLVSQSTACKIARGEFIKWCATNDIKEINQLKEFDIDGYKLSSSNEQELIFVK